MAPNHADRAIIEDVLQDYIRIPYAYGDLQAEAVFDREHDRYIVVTIGWDVGMRVYSVLVHIDVLNDKVWVQQDNTEDGIATELVQAGIPKERIVLGFRPREVRHYTDFAVA